MRSTKILSMGNRLVLAPNLQIGKNQVVNYSYLKPCQFFVDLSILRSICTKPTLGSDHQHFSQTDPLGA